MKFLKGIFIVFLAALFLVSLVSASFEVAIDVEPEFNYGEEVFFEYTFIPYDFEGNVNYVPSVSCENGIHLLLQEESIFLKSGIQEKLNYSYGTVGDQHTSSLCIATIQIIFPYDRFFSKNFYIITDPSIDFNIILDKKVFSKNENINIDYTSSVSDLSIQAVLTYPNKKTESVNLPKEIEATQIGTYELEVAASKEGYKSITIEEQFGVIEKGTRITDQSDSRDDLEERKGRKIGENWFFYIVGGIVILIFVIIFFLLKMRNKRTRRYRFKN